MRKNTRDCCLLSSGLLIGFGQRYWIVLTLENPVHLGDLYAITNNGLTNTDRIRPIAMGIQVKNSHACYELENRFY